MAETTRGGESAPERSLPVSGEKRSPRERQLNVGEPAGRKKADADKDTLYRDRPTDDGTSGDGGQEPNAGFPHKTE